MNKDLKFVRTKFCESSLNRVFERARNLLALPQDAADVSSILERDAEFEERAHQWLQLGGGPIEFPGVERGLTWSD
jgi:hypothetical protein